MMMMMMMGIRMMPVVVCLPRRACTATTLPMRLPFEEKGSADLERRSAVAQTWARKYR